MYAHPKKKQQDDDEENKINLIAATQCHAHIWQTDFLIQYYKFIHISFSAVCLLIKKNKRIKISQQASREECLPTCS